MRFKILKKRHQERLGGFTPFKNEWKFVHAHDSIRPTIYSTIPLSYTHTHTPNTFKYMHTHTIIPSSITGPKEDNSTYTCRLFSHFLYNYFSFCFFVFWCAHFVHFTLSLLLGIVVPPSRFFFVFHLARLSFARGRCYTVVGFLIKIICTRTIIERRTTTTATTTPTKNLKYALLFPLSFIHSLAFEYKKDQHNISEAL